MKVKVFLAPTMQEAVMQVKTELGSEAVILQSRRIRKGGFLGFFGKEMFEVIAGIEPAVVQEKEKSPAMRQRGGEDDTKTAALQIEVAHMRKTLEQLISKMPQNEKYSSDLFKMMIKNDIEHEIAENLLRGIIEEGASVDSEEIGRRILFERVCSYLQRVDGINVPERGCKIVALIGPTGVGKTTTIAKLAANFSIKEGYKVALITADTYRIAAVEQLKTYSDIIGVPLDIVYSPDELKAALYRHRDKNLVLIDTAGRSPHNSYQLAELQALLAVEPYIETHLVLSATTKSSDLVDIVNSFGVCSPQKFLLTKIDEAATLGIILNLLYQYPTTLSYVTTGQNVPDDIELASSHKLANLILRD